MATTSQPQYLYMVADELYRLGNSINPKLDHVRPGEFQTYERNGIVIIRATGIGLSLGTLDCIENMGLSGWLWKIPADTAMPTGLYLNPDPDPNRKGHYFCARDLICL